jgi:hypothetical protein
MVEWRERGLFKPRPIVSSARRCAVHPSRRCSPASPAAPPGRTAAFCSTWARAVAWAPFPCSRRNLLGQISTRSRRQVLRAVLGLRRARLAVRATTIMAALECATLATASSACASPSCGSTFHVLSAWRRRAARSDHGRCRRQRAGSPRWSRTAAGSSRARRGGAECGREKDPNKAASGRAKMKKRKVDPVALGVASPRGSV